MPITTEVYAVLYEDKPVQQAVRDLMARELGYEFDPRAIARATLRRAQSSSASRSRPGVEPSSLLDRSMRSGLRWRRSG